MTMAENHIGPLKDRRHERFAIGLAEMKTQIDAYAAAGYVPSLANAGRLAKSPTVRARVAELLEEQRQFANVRRERVVVNLDQVASVDIGDLYETVEVDERKFERLKPLSRMTRAQRAAIQSVDTDPRTGERRVRLHDRTAANNTLLKFLGGLPEAPSTPTFNIFNVLSADDQRALADTLEAAGRGAHGSGDAAPGERGQD